MDSTKVAAAETAAGTLSTALAVMDDEMDHDEAKVPDRMRAAWATVRAAAIKSLEPAPDLKPNASLTDRARGFYTAVHQQMHQLSQEPSPDAATAIHIASLMAAPTFTVLMLEALAGIADAVRARGHELDGIARELALTRRALVLDVHAKEGQSQSNGLLVKIADNLGGIEQTLDQANRQGWGQ